MEQTPVYDIRTSENAMKTLVALTGVSPDVWKRYFSRESEYAYPEDLIEDVIQKHGKFPVNYTDWTFIYFHVTTSADQCASFYKHGILDLVHSYQCTDSELRKFLDAHDIEIDIDNQTLCYKKRIYDISYGKCPFDSQSEPSRVGLLDISFTMILLHVVSYLHIPTLRMEVMFIFALKS